MTKYLLAFALSYFAALLLFAALGVVSLFRWPSGAVPTAFSRLWAGLPYLAVLLPGLLSARRWGAEVGALSVRGLLILLAVMILLVLLAWRADVLRPLSEPGRMAGTLVARLLNFRREGVEPVPLTFAGNLLFPLLFHLGWRLGG